MKSERSLGRAEVSPADIASCERARSTAGAHSGSQWVMMRRSGSTVVPSAGGTGRSAASSPAPGVLDEGSRFGAAGHQDQPSQPHPSPADPDFEHVERPAGSAAVGVQPQAGRRHNQANQAYSPPRRRASNSTASSSRSDRQVRAETGPGHSGHLNTTEPSGRQRRRGSSWARGTPRDPPQGRPGSAGPAGPGGRRRRLRSSGCRPPPDHRR